MLWKEYYINNIVEKKTFSQVLPKGEYNNNFIYKMLSYILNIGKKKIGNYLQNINIKIRKIKTRILQEKQSNKILCKK